MVVSFLGNAGMPQQKAIVDAAVKSGVKRFIPSEFGSRTHDARVRAIVPVFQGKRAVVEYLESKSGITWTGVVTGPFFDWVRVMAVKAWLAQSSTNLFSSRACKRASWASTTRTTKPLFSTADRSLSLART